MLGIYNWIVWSDDGQRERQLDYAENSIKKYERLSIIYYITSFYKHFSQ